MTLGAIRDRSSVADERTLPIGLEGGRGVRSNIAISEVSPVRTRQSPQASEPRSPASMRVTAIE